MSGGSRGGLEHGVPVVELLGAILSAHIHCFVWHCFVVCCTLICSYLSIILF